MGNTPQRDKKSGLAPELMEGLILLSQFGMSIAVSLGLCLFGASWLRDRFGLGNWIFLPAILAGLWMAVGSFRSISVYQRNRDAWNKKQKALEEKEARRREIRQTNQK